VHQRLSSSRKLNGSCRGVALRRLASTCWLLRGLHRELAGLHQQTYPSHPTTPHTATCSCRARRLRRILMLHNCINANAHCKHLAAGSSTPSGRDDIAWTRSSASTASARVATAVHLEPPLRRRSRRRKQKEDRATGARGTKKRWGHTLCTGTEITVAAAKS
jgi:hypothetical protein